MATEMEQLRLQGSNGTFTFEIADSEAREAASTANTTAEAAKKTAQEAKTAAANASAALDNKQPKGNYALRSELPDVPTNVSELNNDAGYITGYTETDPTVPAWAKAPKKPTYTAEEVGARPATWMPSAADVGALPDTTVIPTAPTKVSQLDNDKGYLTAVPDGYVTDEELESRGYLTEHQSLDEYAKKKDIPTIPATLPNPKKLTFTGAATGEYDGSTAVVINVPDGAECNIQRIESLDGSNMKNFRDIDSGTYILYGYFNPYAGAPESYTIDNCFAAVVHLNVGSHVMVYNPRNFKIECYEILENDGSYTYTKDVVSMLDLSQLISIDGIKLMDRTTGEVRTLYLDNGKLSMTTEEG